jgi:hypothetical protein
MPAFVRHTYPTAAQQVPINFTLVYMGLGRHGEAIDWLERAYDARSIYMVTANNSPLFDPLRSEPRFQALLQRMNFPPTEAGD